MEGLNLFFAIYTSVISTISLITSGLSLWAMIYLAQTAGQFAQNQALVEGEREKKKTQILERIVGRIDITLIDNNNKI